MPDFTFPKQFNQRLRVFTWHIHGTYLYYLSRGDYEIFIPVSKEAKPGYVGRGTTFPFGENVHEVDEDEVKNLDFDVILIQTKKKLSGRSVPNTFCSTARIAKSLSGARSSAGSYTLYQTCCKSARYQFGTRYPF